MDQSLNNATGSPSAEGNIFRKFVKDRGNDGDSFRKNREDKAVQLRKEKRSDRTNIERRKFKVDTKENENTITTFNLRRLDILPKKAALLYDADPKVQFESAVYFRRVLAADKNPPLDAILQIGTVLPALAGFLTRFEHQKLQFEAAWSITNIACGESRHIQALIECNVIQLFSNLIAQTNNANIKEQSLWALSNMSSEESCCTLICQERNLINLILYQIGVHCHYPDPINQPDFVRPRHLSENDNPSLSIMRHITFICGNIVKQRPQISGYLYNCILFSFADLLQSPDDEIKLDICQTLAIASSQQPEIIPAIAEQGLISRLKELAFETSSTSSTKELAMVAICSIFKSSPAVFAKAIITNFQLSNTPLSSMVLHLLNTTTNNASRRDAIQATIVWVNLGSFYKLSVANVQLWNCLKELILQGTYDVKMDVATLACKLFPDVIPYLNYELTVIFLEIYRETISFTNGELLCRALQSISHLLAYSAANFYVLQHLPVLHERIEFLVMHPMKLICVEAQNVEKLILALLRQNGGDFDEYGI